jgi:hypothetical protein
MATWPLLETSRVRTVGTSGSTGTTVTASASANTKGSWAQISAATPCAADAIIVSLINVTNAVDMLIDLGIGGAGSETVIVANLTASCGSSGPGTNGVPLLLPIALSDGTRLAARCQSTTGSSTISVIVHLVQNALLTSAGLASVQTYGANTADSGGTSIDPGATINTKGAWTEISASTSSNHSALIIGVGNQANTSRSTASYQVDIGIGAGGSETILIPDIHLREDSTQDVTDPTIIPPFFVTVPAGTRLAARANCSINDATDRLIDLFLYGVG